MTTIDYTAWPYAMLECKHDDCLAYPKVVPVQTEGEKAGKLVNRGESKCHACLRPMKRNLEFEAEARKNAGASA